MSRLLHRSLVGDCCLLIQWLGLSVVLVLLPLHEGVVGQMGQSGMEKGKRPIYIGALLPTSLGSKWRPSERLTPAIHHAIQDVNRNTSVLSNYTLHIIFEETECNTKIGLDKYLDLVEILPRKLMLLSGLCTELTAEIERASQLSMTKVPQISYGNSDSVFDDNYEHPNLFRIVPSESQFNAARLKLLVELGWVKGLGTLYQNTPTYSIPHNRQLVSLYRHEIPVLETQHIGGNKTRLTDELRQLKAKGVQVVLGNFNETWARRVFCQAYKVDMYGEKFSWILAGAYDAQWWKVEDTDCFPHELERALQGMIRIDILPLTTEVQEMKAPAFRNTYKLQSSSKLHGYVYDGIWAMALALNNISYFYAEVENSGRSWEDYRATDMLSNSSFIYANPIWLTALRQALSATSFRGVTGPVSFDNQARRGHSLLIKQFQASMSGYDEVSVGEFDSISGSLDLKKYPTRVLRSHDDFQRFEREQELLDPTHYQSTVEDQQTRPSSSAPGPRFFNSGRSSSGSNISGLLGTLFLLGRFAMGFVTLN